MLSPTLRLAHTAHAPTIGIGSLEWMDMSYVYCICNCINLKTYSSICIDLCYVVWSAIWLFILITSIFSSRAVGVSGLLLEKKDGLPR
jgi:hypothetical protein